MSRKPRSAADVNRSTMRGRKRSRRHRGPKSCAVPGPRDISGTTDNYVSNEITVPGLNAAAAWKSLNDTAAWPDYYSNVSDIRFHDGHGPTLQATRFRFTTFQFPVEAEVVEYVAPDEGELARIAWHGWVEGDAKTRLDVHHAWLFEDCRADVSGS